MSNGMAIMGRNELHFTIQIAHLMAKIGYFVRKILNRAMMQISGACCGT
jgi:hypothetical protein